MNKTPTKDHIISYLHSYGMSPIRSLGQNFLIDNEIANLIVTEAALQQGDDVLEIGPGFGALTSHIIKHVQKLDLVELDQKMVTFLKDHYSSEEAIKIIHKDALKLDFSHYTKIISNLPYYATTAMIEKTYREAGMLKDAVFMIQKEAFPRLSANVNEDGYGPLAIVLSYIMDITTLFVVKPHSFYPEPPVDSLVIKLTVKQEINREMMAKLDRVVRRLFENRRKTILNNLGALIHDKNRAKMLLIEIGVMENTRPEQIPLEKYLKLTELIYR